MEIVLEQLLEKNWDNFNMPCQCEKCKTDVLAIALNQAPARYISKDNSLAFVKAEFLESQSETNLLIYLSKAAQIVAKNPSCKGNS